MQKIQTDQRKQTSITSKNQDKVAEEEQELFECFCQKQYQSFPALYFHIRQKHDISIKRSQKNSMRSSVKMNGNKKKVKYYADYDKLVGNNQEAINDHRNRDFDLDRGINRIEVRQSESSIELPNQLKRFIEEYHKYSSHNMHDTGEHRTIKKLMEQLYSFSLEQKNPQEIPQESLLSSLPLLFNDFLTKWFPKKRVRSCDQLSIKIVLLRLSNWLYTNQLSPYLAIQNS